MDNFRERSWLARPGEHPPPLDPAPRGFPGTPSRPQGESRTRQGHSVPVPLPTSGSMQQNRRHEATVSRETRLRPRRAPNRRGTTAGRRPVCGVASHPVAQPHSERTPCLQTRTYAPAGTPEPCPSDWLPPPPQRRLATRQEPSAALLRPAKSLKTNKQDRTAAKWRPATWNSSSNWDPRQAASPRPRRTSNAHARKSAAGLRGCGAADKAADKKQGPFHVKRALAKLGWQET